MYNLTEEDKKLLDSFVEEHREEIIKRTLKKLPLPPETFTKEEFMKASNIAAEEFVEEWMNEYRRRNS